MPGNAGSIRAGAAFVEFYGNDSKLIRTMRSIEKRMQAFGASVQKIGTVFAGLGASIAAPMLAAAKAFADTGSALNDLSAKTGVSVESLSTLKYAAEQSGASLGSVETGFKAMAKSVDAAAQGGKEAVETFDRLGTSAAELKALKPDDQFRLIASRLEAVTDPGEKAALAMKVFGKSGADLLPMVNGLAATEQKARDLGLVMSTESAAAADELGDAMDTLKATAGAAALQIGGALAPALTQVLNDVIAAIPAWSQWISQNKDLVVTVFKGATALTAAGTAIAGFGKGISLAGSAVGIASKAISGAASAVQFFTSGTQAATVAVNALKAASVVGGLVAGAFWVAHLASDTERLNRELERAAKLSTDLASIHGRRVQRVDEEIAGIADPAERKKRIEEEIATAEQEMSGFERRLHEAKAAADEVGNSVENWLNFGKGAGDAAAQVEQMQEAYRNAKNRITALRNELEKPTAPTIPLAPAPAAANAPSGGLTLGGVFEGVLNTGRDVVSSVADKLVEVIEQARMARDEVEATRMPAIDQIVEAARVSSRGSSVGSFSAFDAAGFSASNDRLIALGEKQVGLLQKIATKKGAVFA